MTRPLGWRRELESDRALELYPFELELAPGEEVERTLALPSWLPSHDQGREGSCVGHAIALERAIVNTAELRESGRAGYRRYDPITLWRAAKAIDQWSYTRPEDDLGTSVRAGYDVAQTLGLRRVSSMRLDGDRPIPYRPAAAGVVLEAGVLAYRWARTVDSIRAAIAAGAPVAIGINWHHGFDSPIERDSGPRGRAERWLPLPSSAGSVRGGHAVALAGASDRRMAFLLVNSWGSDYPPVWIPYETMSSLLARRAEVAIVTDRRGNPVGSIESMDGTTVLDPRL